MATSNQTYPSSSWITSPSSPSDSSSPSTPTDDPTYGGDNPAPVGDLLSANGSPPLVVAFLAIGLFVVALVVAFVWRLRSRRGWAPPVWTRRRKPIAIGKRPHLWDLWACVPGPEDTTGNIEDSRWKNLTPLAVVLMFARPPEPQPEEPSPLTKPTESHHLHMMFSAFNLLMSAVRRRFRISLLPEPPSPPPPPPPSISENTDADEKHTEESRSLNELEWRETSSIQFSVIIAMPTRRTPLSSTSSRSSQTDVDLEHEEMREYCIGTMDVPLSEGG